MKQRIVLVISVVVGLLAFWMTRAYFQARNQSLVDERNALLASLHQTPVLAAFCDLPAGSVLRKEDLATKPSYERDISQDTVLPDAQDLVSGKKLRVGLMRGQTLLYSYVDLPYRPGSGLAPMINSGLRAISVSVGGASAVSGLVQPNDRVDVLGSFMLPSKLNAEQMEAVTITILQDVTVLATGQTLGKTMGDRTERTRSGMAGYSTVTFEVTPREAELLAFVENMKGRLTLSLRNPSDVSFEKDLPSVNFETVQKELPDLNNYRQDKIRHKGGR